MRWKRMNKLEESEQGRKSVSSRYVRDGNSNLEGYQPVGLLAIRCIELEKVRERKEWVYRHIVGGGETCSKVAV